MKPACFTRAALLTGALFLGTGGTATAQDLGSLKGLAGGGDVASMVSGNAGNAAGILKFCIKNNFLGDDAAGAMKDRLLDKAGINPDLLQKDDATAEESEEQQGYLDGAKGLLKTGDGNVMDLANMDGLKKSLTKKACSSVLDHAGSFL